MQPGAIVFKGKTKKGLDIIIRYPKADDLMAILNYINTLVKEGAPLLIQKELTVEQEKEVLDGILKGIEMGRTIYLSVWNKDNLIGTVWGNIGLGAHRHVFGFGISVSKEFRSKGLGELVMEIMLKEARHNLNGVKVVYLGVFANNIPAINLYKKLNFIECGRFPDGLFYKGEYFDEIFMYKKIN